MLDIDSGIIEECGEEALKYKSKQIINKELIKIKWIVKDDGDEFHNTIKKKYKEFNRKSKLLGLSNDFRYRIIGKEVIITEYLGTSGKLVVPSFITGINDRAFNRIKGIELHKDIKYIRKHIDLEHMDIECNMDYKSNNGIVKEWL